MSFISKSVKTVIFLALAVIVILLTPISNDVKFTEFRLPSSPIYSNGENILNNAERLFEGFIRGPECFAIYKDELYISAHGGWVYKLSDDQLIKVVKTGNDCDEHWWEEVTCGRPLGIKIDSSGILYIVDTYFGLFKLNLSSGEYDSNLKQIVSLDVPIGGHVPKLPNCIDKSEDGSIYWTDSSFTHTLNYGAMVMIADGSGRLLKLNETSGENEVLMDNLSFANGVVLSKDESFIAVAETGRSRVHKYHLKGPKAGSSEILIENLPGYPDNLRLNKDGNIVITLMNPFKPGRNMIEIFGKFPNLRMFAYKFFKLLDVSVTYIYSIYPHHIIAYIRNWVGHLESINLFVEKGVKVFILESDQNQVKKFKVLNSDDGRISHVSDFIEFKGYYYLGSPYNNYLGRVKV